MVLPIRTTTEDIESVCKYLATKPIGATVQEARAVLDAKRLDGRKLSALKFWGLIEQEDERLKVTEAGRELVRSGVEAALLNVIRQVEPYRAIVERVAHRNEKSLNTSDVAAHWHEHFRDAVSDKESTLNDQSVCFFQVVSGAGLGTLLLGRRGAPTRLDFDAAKVSAFVGAVVSPVVDAPAETSSETVDEFRDVSTSQRNGYPEETLDEGIFVGHGKNTAPLEQLKRILGEFKIPYKVAVDEPHLGRPISAKVRETMRSCNCAILIFTADEELQDKDGNVIWRPSENVIHEFGAASYLYEDRVVVMKEEDVHLPSNFSDIGYISFEKDRLEGKAMEILRELIGFGIVKVST